MNADAHRKSMNLETLNEVKGLTSGIAHYADPSASFHLASGLWLQF